MVKNAFQFGKLWMKSSRGCTIAKGEGYFRCTSPFYFISIIDL